MWGVNHPAETSAPSASGGVASVGGGITSTGDAGSATTSAAPAGGASAGASAPAADVTSTASAAAGTAAAVACRLSRTSAAAVASSAIRTYHPQQRQRRQIRDGDAIQDTSYHLACKPTQTAHVTNPSQSTYRLGRARRPFRRQRRQRLRAAGGRAQRRLQDPRRPPGRRGRGLGRRGTHGRGRAGGVVVVSAGPFHFAPVLPEHAHRQRALATAGDLRALGCDVREKMGWGIGEDEDQTLLIRGAE